MTARLATLLMMATVVPGLAQSSDSALIRAAGALPPGSVIRVELPNGQRASGALQGVGLHGLELSDQYGRRELALQDVTRLWQRKRAVGAGAVVGGVLGAGTGVFFGLVASALCEYGCGSPGTSMTLGGLIGGALGAGTGAIIGAAIPRWSTIYRRQELPSARPAGQPFALRDVRPVPRRNIGELSLMALAGAGGYEGNTAQAVPAQRGVVAGGVAGLAFRAGRFSLGPEGGLLRGEFNIWSLGGVIRYATAADDPAGAPRVTPHVTAGLGAVGWETNFTGQTLLTGTFGGGVTSPAGWRAEIRWHPSFQNTGSPKPALVTVGAGYRLSW